MRPDEAETTPPPVPRVSGATQGGETVSRWDWVEPSVWTKRMLAALENGVKGGVWFSLIGKRDQQCWTNAYFRKQGLFSLEAAYAETCQSSRR